MGIRMLHRRAGQHGARPRGQSSAQAGITKAALHRALPSVPPFAPGAAAGRIPTTPAAARRAVAKIRRVFARRDATAVRDTPAWRRWAERARGYVDRLLTRLPERRPEVTVTVFTLSEPPGRPVPR